MANGPHAVPPEGADRAGLGFVTRLAYGLPSLAIALCGAPLIVYLPRHYTDSLGANLTVLGLVLLLSRAFDAVTDPLVGYLSDRTVGRWGRRRSWIAMATLPLCLVVLALYAPPSAGPTMGTLWISVGVVLFYGVGTAFLIPYRALGVELTHEHDERSKLFAMRESLLVVGMVLGMASPLLAGAFLSWLELPSDDGARFRLVGVVAAGLLAASAALCVALVEEPAAEPAPKGPPGRHRLRELARCRPFVVLVVAGTIAAFGNNLPAALASYFAANVLGIDQVGPYLLAFLGTGILALPLGMRLAARVGRRDALRAAIMWNTVPFLGVAFLGRGDATAYLVLVALSGIGGVTTIALLPAMLADVVDYDAVRTGLQREGQLVGLGAIAEKLAAAAGVGVALPLLDLAGYVPGGAQPARAIVALKLLYVVVPCLCNLAAVLLLARYPIDRAARAAIEAARAARAAGLPFVDPLATPAPTPARAEIGS
jgi:glycoside/pentoside/hexuronide:cation symporter, GPH family